MPIFVPSVVPLKRTRAREIVPEMKVLGVCICRQMPDAECDPSSLLLQVTDVVRTAGVTAGVLGVGLAATVLIGMARSKREKQ